LRDLMQGQEQAQPHDLGPPGGKCEAARPKETWPTAAVVSEGVRTFAEASRTSSLGATSEGTLAVIIHR
jgi:hypothetical protein